MQCNVNQHVRRTLLEHDIAQNRRTVSRVLHMW
jgi:hypothetical protein